MGKKEVGKYGPPKWVFNFKKDYADNYKVFSLETKEYPGEVQGVIALIDLYDGYYGVRIKDVESAEWNKSFIKGLEHKGKNVNRKYKEVGTNLVAFACQYSILKGLNGFVQLKSKSTTIKFYEEIGFELFDLRERIMILDEEPAQALANDYFEGGVINWLD